MSGKYIVRSSQDGATEVLWPIDEAARQVARTTKTLYRHAQAGRLDLIRDGGRTYVEANELARYRLDIQGAAK